MTAATERMTEGARKVLELSLREALSLGHNYIGTEHILLGLVRENEGLASKVLLALDVDANKVRNEVIRQHSAPKVSPPEPPSLADLLRLAADELDAA